MDEIAQVLRKYDEDYVRQHFTDAGSINSFALSFYKDASDIYDAVTRVRNIERNPNEFDLNDAPILGLLVRIWKLLKEILKYYGLFRLSCGLPGVVQRLAARAARSPSVPLTARGLPMAWRLNLRRWRFGQQAPPAGAGRHRPARAVPNGTLMTLTSWPTPASTHTRA